MKTEIAYSWDWKRPAPVLKITERIKKFTEDTGKFPYCYDVNTKMDSYGFLISSQFYEDSDFVSKKWYYLWAKQNGASEADLKDLALE